MRGLNLPTFKFYTGKSFAFHAVLVIFGLVLSYTQWVKFERVKNYNLSLASRSVKVDVVAMPKLSLPELKELAKVKGQLDGGEVIEPAKPQVKDNTPDTGNEFLKETKKKKKKSLSEMLKQYSDKNVEAKKVVKKKAKGNNGQKEISDEMKKKLSDLVFAGNKVSEGNAIYGDAGVANAGILKEYIEKIPDIVRPRWKLPSYLIDKQLRCRVRVYLSAEGRLIKSEIFESSGDDEYDNRALNAVKETTFPRPPQEVKQMAANGAIVLGFPL
tara:strand:- start:10671 stop:11483 length:813 start_codon:yes stop_codon:yes gene_type:complete